MFRFLIVILPLFVTYAAIAQKQQSIRFIENKGQWDAPFHFKANLPGGVLFAEKDGFTYSFYNSNEYRFHDFDKQGTTLKLHSFKINFLNSNTFSTIRKGDAYPSYYNYFIGNHKDHWKSNVKAYKGLTYYELYEGIDLELYAQGEFLKYDIVVKPEGNLNNVKLSYKGVNKLTIDKSGNLHIQTSVNEIVEQRPYTYQIKRGKKVEIPCQFVLENETISFKILGNYNRKADLIIDPILIFASYSGSSADNFGMTATYGYDGSLFAGGTTFDIGYPTTLGAIDSTFNGTVTQGVTDIVISRYDSTGINLIYSTYIGGAFAETVHSIVANTQNELYLYGATSSLDFPTSNNAYDTSFNGGSFISFPQNGTTFNNGSDIYVAKINALGTELLGSTYIGGSGNDGINYTVTQTYDTLMKNYGDQYRGEIILDRFDNCYITSSTKSANFPTVNGFDDQLDGHQDAIVMKLTKDLDDLQWSSYLGGDNADAGFSLKVDTNHFVYVSGGTNSTNFPQTAGSIHNAYQGGASDGYLTKIDSNGSTIIASTFIGTNAYDQCYFIEIDRFGSIYTIGQTEGSFPVFNANYSNPISGQFIAKYNNNLTSTIYTTVFGNGNNTINFSPSAFLVDRCQNVYVSGWGGNILGTGAPLLNMPVSNGAFQEMAGDGYNFYLFVLERDAESLLYGTYFGGNLSQEHVDGGTSRFDKDGIVYQSVCAGCGGNDDFPTTNGVWSTTNNSTNCNNGVFKFDFEIVPQANFTVDNQQGCLPLTVNFNNTSRNISRFLWDFGNNDTTSQILNPTRIYDSVGVFQVTLLITDSICDVTDTAYQTITVSAPNDASTIWADRDTIIKGSGTFLHVTPDSGFTFLWDGNVPETFNRSASPYVTPEKTTTYTVEITNEATGCSYSKTITVYVVEINCAEPDIFLPNAFTPNGDGENDLLLLRGNYITEMHLAIYNRWGEKVFETTDQKVGWDGTFKGESVEPNVFVYHLTALCADGQEYFKKGNITVIK